ncbi:hypothetical protein HY947_06145 [Candidatus Gottesmanbacteria bacterium]|nr:hypothetical protein [Candidatus Gottesmanbacteria bacterium]
MIEANKDLFDAFAVIHDKYVLDPDLNKAEFNSLGEKVLVVISKYEQILCGKTENGGLGKFSSILSQKFWDEIKKHYKKILFIGIK